MTLHRSLSLLGVVPVIAATLAFSGGCAAESADEDTETSSDELRSHAQEAGLYEYSAQGQGVVALVNDRFLTVDDYVYNVKISRATAQAIIAVRNGTNGVQESRAHWGGGGGSSSSASSSGGWSSSSSSGGPVPPPSSSGSSTPPVDPTGPGPVPYPYPYPCGVGGSTSSSSGWSGGTGGSTGTSGTGGSTGSSGTGSTTSSSGWSPPPPPPPPPPCRPYWELGGDDERFVRLSEIDALPGTDVSAFNNLRQYAMSNGYVTGNPGPGPGPHPVVDGGPPPPPATDGGVVFADAAVPPHP